MLALKMATCKILICCQSVRVVCNFARCMYVCIFTFIAAEYQLRSPVLSGGVNSPLQGSSGVAVITCVVQTLNIRAHMCLCM